MFLTSAASDEKIRELIATRQELPFSYSEVGATQSKPPSDYTIDHNRTKLGQGENTYIRAVAALRVWKQFDLGWTRAAPPRTPIEAGQIVAVQARAMGIWSLNFCRIVYVIKEDRKFGFAYGTLSEHVEQGEERFLIEWDADDDSVWYDILAFSRPRHLLVRAARPLARRLQRRFARDSMQSMRTAVGA